MTKRCTYLLLFVSLVVPAMVKAQNWQPKGALFEDKNIRVELEYSLGDDPCVPNGNLARFRYHIIKTGRHQDFFIAWRFDYFNCDHELKSQFNSLHITPNAPAYVTPINNSFPAKQIVNHMSYIKTSSRAPEDNIGYRPSSASALGPKSINGRSALNAGETTLLSLKGGYLAEGASWKWYEGECGGIPVGTGVSLAVRPLHNTTYFVRAEGKTNTPCVSFEVSVNGTTATSVMELSGPREVCAGNQIHLSVTGSLGTNMRWVWYQQQVGSTAAGEGESILLSPNITTTYYVRAEGPAGVSPTRSWTVQVIPAPLPAEGINGPRTAAPRSFQTYSIRNGTLNGEAQWIWYQLIAGKYYRVGMGNSTTLQMPASDFTVAVRAEGSCENSPYTELPVAIRSFQTPDQPQPISETNPTPTQVSTENKIKVFINGGLMASNSKQLNKPANYFATIGVGNRIGGYLRYKFATDPAVFSYETISGQINNYDQPGYYQYTGQQVSKRNAYTGGLFFGSPVISVYLGAGYGEYQSLYEISEQRYTDGYYNTAYVLDQSASLKGAEFEGGLLLRISYFNLMVGAASLLGKYTDYHAGIGFNF